MTVNGEVFHNAEGDGVASTLEQAFAESCNTAFIGLVDNHLRPRLTVQATAAAYGLGTTPQIGLNAVAASVPLPRANGLAAAAIGQGKCCCPRSTWPRWLPRWPPAPCATPRWWPGRPTTPPPPHALPAAVVTQLQQMMVAVVTLGTAAGTGLPAGTYAKTGTAEYGTTNPLKIDAWLMGFKDNVAFAVLTVDSPGNGGPTDGPIAAQFLDHM